MNTIKNKYLGEACVEFTKEAKCPQPWCAVLNTNREDSLVNLDIFMGEYVAVTLHNDFCDQAGRGILINIHDRLTDRP